LFCHKLFEFSDSYRPVFIVSFTSTFPWRKGFFLTEELKNRGISGVFAGATRKWKMSTYGLTWPQIHALSDAFIEIAEKYELPVKKEQE